MITNPGWSRQLALSLFKKETTYDAGVTISDANACSMSSYDQAPIDWEDKLASDKDSVSGSEMATQQQILYYGSKLPYKEARAKPNTVAGLAALVLGSCVSDQDSSLTAYNHRITPVAFGVALPSIMAIEKIGAVQYGYKGIKGNTLNISAKDEDGFVSVESELIGSGTRAVSTDSFPDKISESWMLLSNAKVWMEDGSNITIAAAATQGAEDISSATPTELSPRIRSFDFSWDNKLAKQIGFGGGGSAHDIDRARRQGGLKLTVLFNDATELGFYENQTVCAVEFDLKGGLIATGGTMYYGMHIVIPALQLKAAPQPKAGPSDTFTQDFDFEILDDGTNDAVIIDVWNAQAAYLAA